MWIIGLCRLGSIVQTLVPVCKSPLAPVEVIEDLGNGSVVSVDRNRTSKVCDGVGPVNRSVKKINADSIRRSSTRFEAKTARRRNPTDRMDCEFHELEFDDLVSIENDEGEKAADQLEEPDGTLAKDPSPDLADEPDSIQRHSQTPGLSKITS